ncbi:uncharacterized protein Z518_06973 [Rhinocladiella mackenziei CBS 650.93]|uniref:SGNH hydrolase-type esterase domain-containing protein n=1 Tax=Rhinocladiella mackenziei CBS 650.93 TaxID=1442369 RepID=A0A0D2IJJ2_9EURO|nr:uncharacterized protein Z518_06973 [Rhinocladiella mackenziei CBS 650.93]KIX03421.1 hypothetical protein Z518_06973 [Rhinocladiella mackenziei CBS 650.93]
MRPSSLFTVFLFFLAVNSIPPDTSLRRPEINSYAALGDSYAAGVGAGTIRWPPHPDFGCGRYSDSYPRQVANHSCLKVEESNFKNLACGGTASSAVLRNQVPYIRGSDLVTITVGGNEVDFSVILNECIYHWNPTSTCDAELVKARMLIESAVLWNNLDGVISGAIKQLKPNALLLITGYARFFNEETAFCDHATFSQTKPLDYLTKSKRKALNQLVSMLNDVIQAMAEVHGAVYVDLDKAFEGHRFCEEGVKEPDIERSETWFFNLSPPDTGTTEIERSLQIQAGGLEVDELEVGTSDILPIKKWRTFHPTSLGHKGISEQIVREVLDRSGSAR